MSEQTPDRRYADPVTIAADTPTGRIPVYHRESQPSSIEFVVLTGMSGAGRSTVEFLPNDPPGEEAVERLRAEHAALRHVIVNGQGDLLEMPGLAEVSLHAVLHLQRGAPEDLTGLAPHDLRHLPQVSGQRIQLAVIDSHYAATSSASHRVIVA